MILEITRRRTTRTTPAPTSTTPISGPRRLGAGTCRTRRCSTGLLGPRYLLVFLFLLDIRIPRACKLCGS